MSGTWLKEFGCLLLMLGGSRGLIFGLLEGLGASFWALGVSFWGFWGVLGGRFWLLGVPFGSLGDTL